MHTIFHKSKRTTRRSMLGFGAISLAAFTFFTPGTLHAAGYAATALVADIPLGSASVDTNLVNAWGLALLSDNEFVVNANENNLAGIYQADGTPTGDYIEVGSAPSGLALNSGSGFQIPAGGKSQPSTMIFSTEEGTILGWNSHLTTPAAITEVDNSEFGAVYKGVAVVGNQLFAADFRNGVVDVYNSKWQWQSAFTDSEVDPGFGPFNVVAINNLLYVTFAKILPPDFMDDEAGPGNGYVDVFTTSGKFVQRLVSHGVLNSPWGVALAPKNFGAFSGDLLVGNFGDGTINAFNPKTGALVGTVSDSGNAPIVIDGLWALEFGASKVAHGKSTPVLYFSAGPNDEGDGLVGTVKLNTP